jgi:hypothetical protein
MHSCGWKSFDLNEKMLTGLMFKHQNFASKSSKMILSFNFLSKKISTQIALPQISFGGAQSGFSRACSWVIRG